MKEHTAKLTILGLSILSFSLATALVWVETSGPGRSATPSVESGNIPFQMVNVTVPEDKFDESMDAIRRFADRNGFAIRIAATTPKAHQVAVDLWRSDIKILGDNPFDTREFGFGFYRNNTEALPASYVQTLVSEFEHDLRAITGVTVSSAK